MTYIAFSDEALEDGAALGRTFACHLWLIGLTLRQATAEEAAEGRQTYQHDDHEHTLSIGWRREQEWAEEEARTEAEMAACPYRVCTCGHHE